MEEQPASKPAAALCYFARLFQLEYDFCRVDSRRTIYQASGAGKEALLAWANALKTQTAPKSSLGKTLHYLLEQ